MSAIQQIRKPIEDHFEQFAALFAEQMTSANPLLNQILRHVSSHSGKQVRPTLVLLAAHLCGTPTQATLNAAAAFELLHNATLLHDDVVDTSMLRRGQSTVNADWGNKVAVLAGDFMLARAIRLGTENDSILVTRLMAEVGEALADGEILQLSKAQTDTSDLDSYYQIIERKTARLFAACAAAGAETAGASDEQVKSLRLYGRELGICFQIRDDMFDYQDSPEIGKPLMNDIREGKITLPLLLALQHTQAEQSATVREILHRRDFSESSLQIIHDFVHQNHGLELSRRAMDEHRSLGLQALSSFPESPTRDSLDSLLHYAACRSL